MLSEAGDNLGSVALALSRQMLRALETGGNVGATLPQLTVGLGVLIDKLAALRQSSDSQVWERVLRADQPEELDRMIEELRKELIKLDRAGI